MNESLSVSVKQDEAQADVDESDVRNETNTCPECKGTIQHSEANRERVCVECGLVLDEANLDRGPEWRSFSNEEAETRSRVGAPVTELLHDKGLSTRIGWQDKDASGNRLSSRKRKQIQRLRTWDERFRTKSSTERNLKQALGEVERMGSALGLPKTCRETGAVTYRKAVDNGLLPGRSIESMASASLYAAARQHNTPRTLAAIENVSRVDKLSIQRAYRYLSKELGLTIAPADPLDYLRQFASALEISDEAERMARDLLETAKQEAIHSGKNPAGLAAAAIYAATQLTNEKLTQATVSDAADVSLVTIRNRYTELLDIYGNHGE